MTYFPSTKLQNSSGTVINPATEDTLTILAHATGTVGSPSVTALTIQGVSGTAAVPIMVSASGGFGSGGGGGTVVQGAAGATAWPVSVSGSVTVTNAAGTAVMGDIGNITGSITPGFAAANLGKKINTADDTANDIGVAIYGIRRDDGALFGAAAANRWGYIAMDSNSHVWFAGSYRDNQAGGTYQASGNYQAASGSVMAIGGIYDESATAVNASAVGYLRMNSRREQIVAQGSAGATAWPVSVSGTPAVTVASIANVTANQGVAGAAAWPVSVSGTAAVSGTVTSNLGTVPTTTAGTPHGITVSTGATALAASNASRNSILISNNSNGLLYLGHTTGVSTSGTAMGFLIGPRGCYSDSGFGLYTGALYGIYSAVAAAPNVTVSERT